MSRAKGYWSVWHAHKGMRWRRYGQTYSRATAQLWARHALIGGALPTLSRIIWHPYSEQYRLRRHPS